MTYRAVATRLAPWWAIEITGGLPDHMFAHTQVRRLTAVHQTAREVIAALTEVDPDDINVEITIRMPTELTKAHAALSASEETARNANTRRSGTQDSHGPDRP